MTKTFAVDDIHLCRACVTPDSPPCVARVVGIDPVLVMPLCVTDDEEPLDLRTDPCSGMSPKDLGPALEPKEYVGYLL